MHGPEFFIFNFFLSIYFVSSFGMGPCVLCDDRQGGQWAMICILFPGVTLSVLEPRDSGHHRRTTRRKRVEEPLHSEKTSFVALFVR